MAGLAERTGVAEGAEREGWRAVREGWRAVRTAGEVLGEEEQ